MHLHRNKCCNGFLGFLVLKEMNRLLEFNWPFIKRGNINFLFLFPLSPFPPFPFPFPLFFSEVNCWMGAAISHESPLTTTKSLSHRIDYFSFVFTLDITGWARALCSWNRVWNWTRGDFGRHFCETRKSICKRNNTQLNIYIYRLFQIAQLGWMKKSKDVSTKSSPSLLIVAICCSISTKPRQKQIPWIDYEKDMLFFLFFFLFFF